MDGCGSALCPETGFDVSGFEYEDSCSSQCVI